MFITAVIVAVSDVFKSYSKPDNGTVSVAVQLSTTARAHPYPPEPFESRLDALSHLDGGFYWRNQSSGARIFKDVAV